MPEEEEAKEEVPKKKAKAEAKTSVKSYKLNIEAEKQKMGAYSKKFGTTVRGLQSNFKKYSKDLKDAALSLKEEGIKEMGSKINTFKGDIKAATKSMDNKVGKFKGDIKDQIKENKESVSHMNDNIKYLKSEIGKTKKDFGSYAKAFWG